jgi:CheY-like chemotaxis protein
MGRFRRNLESVFPIDPNFSTRSLQEPPDTVASVPPEGKAHWNSAAEHGRATFQSNAEGKPVFSSTTATKDEIIGTILAIGEIPANLDFDCATLESSGYKVILAGSVNRALRLTEEEETQPDLVLCDLHMRPLGGLDFLEIAKRTPALRQVPIVIISSTCTFERERRNCLELGAARFVRRPIRPEALLAEIAEALSGIRRGGGHENSNC